MFGPGHYSQGEILGPGSQDRHGSLGTHTVDRGQQAVAPLLLPAGKAVDIVSILPDGFGDKQLCRLIQL